MKDTLRIHTIIDNSICDGPGIRMVLFCQGCHRHCKGCHNPGTWDSQKGFIWETDSLAKYIVDHAKTKRLTISGGEPLDQYHSVLSLINCIKAIDVSFDIALYTGFDLIDIASELLSKLNYIKVGCYKQELRSTTIDYIGSINQEFIDLTKERKNER